MADLAQTLVWTALPVGREGNRLHAAVFVSPRLQCAGGGTRFLRDFPDFLDWTGKVADDLSFAVSFSSGATADAEPDRELLDPGLWRHLFSEKTPVFPYEFPAGRARAVASFPVTDTMTFIRDTYGTIGREVVADPAHRLPVVLRSPGYFALRNTLGDVTTDGFAGSVPRLDGDERCAYDPAGEFYTGRKGRASGNLIPPAKMAFFQAFRFFNPPQLAAYVHQQMVNHHGKPWNREDDDRDWKRKPVPVPQFDFHRILAALGDHPTIMRKLGLVISFDIPIPKNTAHDGWFRAVPRWRRALSSVTTDLCPRTWYSIRDDRFLAQPRTGGEHAPLQDGWLNLKGTGDISAGGPATSPFGITQVDSDGAALKVLHFAATLALYPFPESTVSAAALPSRQEKSLPAAQGLPALRSAGISLFRNSRAWQLAKMLNPSDPASAAAKNTLLESSTPGSAQPLDLYAEDLLRGYRADIEDRARPHIWHSLCRRSGTYRVTDVRDGTAADPVEIDAGDQEEGYVKGASAASYDNLTLYVHESLLHWDGWSLCVRRPGRTILEDGKPADVTGDPVEHIGLQGEFSVPAGSLPALRFGHSYRLRVRAVDIAGNDMTGDLRKWDSREDARASEPVLYHRFDPLAPPPLIPRRPVKEGESLETLVIRSDDQISTAAYAASLNSASGSGYAVTCERHVIPPRTSELMAERHGMFDTWIGKDLPAGSYEAGFKMADREKWNPVPEGDVEKNPGDAFLDQDNCEVRFLPDPLADAVIFTGLPGVPVNPVNGESEYTVPLISRKGGDWPGNRVAFRFVLHEVPLDVSGLEKAPVWKDDAASRDLHVFLTKGCVRKVRYCTVYRTDPGSGGHPSTLMGVAEWMKYGADAHMAADIDAVVMSGRHWMISPYRELTLVHAVQHPLAKPVIQSSSCPGLPLMANKVSIGDTGAQICAKFRIDAKSTGKVDLLARWSEPVDNPADNAPADKETAGHAFAVTVDDPASDIIRITPGTGNRYIHEFGDTRHRFVDYTLRATSRFREFIPEARWGDLTLDGDEYKRVNVLNSARPSAPRVVSILPLFGWGAEETIAVTRPEKKRGRNHKTEGKRRVRHGGGLRVYLERPWFSSGEGELLGVVVWQDMNPWGSVNERNARTMQNVTLWGSDPIYDADRSDPADIFPGLDCFLNAAVKDRDRSPAESGAPFVSVAGFPVQFDTDRRLWYADIHMDTGTAYFPFVRFALARYQPDSIRDAHLSNIILARFAQLAPGRTASVTYDPDDAEGLNVRVVVRGIAQGPELIITAGLPVGGIVSPNAVVVTVERMNPAIQDPDLRWVPVQGKKFSLKAEYEGPYSVMWSGDLTLPARRGTEPFRLMIREYEPFAGEPVQEDYPEDFTMTRTNLRLVYAESFII